MKVNKLAAIGALLLSVSAFAETRYVTDTMYVPIRSGAGNQYRIVHKGIKSGTKLTVIDAPADTEWTQIKTPGGLEGWMPNQYLEPSPTAEIKLIDAYKDLATNTQKMSELEATLTKLKSEHGSLSTDASKQSKEFKKLSEQYTQLKALSADAVDLSQRYQDLLTKHELLKTDFDTVHAENDRLKSDKTINQWLFGAGLTILGMILMLILPALKPQKGNSDWVN